MLLFALPRGLMPYATIHLHTLQSHAMLLVEPVPLKSTAADISHASWC